MRVAITTFAILKQPYGHPEVQEFDDRTPDVFLEAEQSDGMIERAKEIGGASLSNFERDWGKWGAFCVPRFYQFGLATGTDQRASTLSVWRDLPSIFGFAYRGKHLTAFRRRAEWFLAGDWPTYAMWWIDDDHVPQWREACDRLEYLHDHGSSPQAFTFERCFDEHGRRLDRTSLKRAPIAPVASR